MRYFILIATTSIIIACSPGTPKADDKYMDSMAELAVKLQMKNYISSDSSIKIGETFSLLETDMQRDSMLLVMENVLKLPPPPPPTAKPKMTQEEYVKYYQSTWDSVKLNSKDGFYLYDDYLNELSAINKEMVAVSESYFTHGSKKSLIEKLRLKLVDSKKMTQATKNYFTYGQPETKFDLKVICENYLEKTLKDPDSYDLDDYNLDGQTKNGYAITLRYRAKNSFGATILEKTQFDIRFDPSQKMYYVHKTHSKLM